MGEKLNIEKEKTARVGLIASIISEGIFKLVKYGVFAFIAYLIFKSIEVLAGLSTDVHFGLELITDLKMSQWFGYVLGGGGFIYGKSERKLRKKTISRMSKEQDSVKKMIDPGKQTSNLKKDGSSR